MFGLFKKKIVVPELNAEDFVPPVSPVDLIPEIRDPNDPTSMLTAYDFETMQEYPFVAQFMERYPLTRLDTNDLALVYISAQRTIEENDKFNSFNGDAPVRSQQDRIMELAWDTGTADHMMEVAERADMLAFSQQLDDELAMVELRSAIEDNNPVTMAARAVNAHPFLAGWFSVDVTNRLKQK